MYKLIRRAILTGIASILSWFDIFLGLKIQNKLCDYASNHNIAWNKCVYGCGLDCDVLNMSTYVALVAIFISPPLLTGFIGFKLSRPSRPISNYVYGLICMSISLISCVGFISTVSNFIEHSI